MPVVARRLRQQLARHGRVAVIDAQAVDDALHRPGLARSAPGEFEPDHAIALHLDAVEATHDFVLLLDDAEVTGWTQRWLDRRPLNHHVHLRPALARDMARLLSGTAVGLVLAGGGARGFAHLGICQALLKRGIEVDCVGGTRVVSVLAAPVASDRPLDEAMAIVRRAFRANPTGDFNRLPLISLIAGRRLRRVIRDAVRAPVGFEADAEDLWKTFCCVASNDTQAREQLVAAWSAGAGAAGQHRHPRRAAADVAPRGPAVRRRHLQQRSGRRDARHARRGHGDRHRPQLPLAAAARIRRGARHLGPAARPPAATAPPRATKCGFSKPGLP